MGNRNLLVIFCFIVLITGCANQPKVVSVTDDKVVVKAQPEHFSEAYHMAQKECQKNAKNAKYITDDTDNLKKVAFNCVGEEEEAAAAAETEAEAVPEEEVGAEMQTEEIAEPEAEMEAEPQPEEVMEEEIPAETEEVSSEEN